jgi:hypothetical protein
MDDSRKFKITNTLIMKPWIRIEIDNNCEQIIMIQPTPEFDGIELYFSEADKTNQTNALYINKEELPIIVKKLQEMMEHVTTN